MVHKIHKNFCILISASVLVFCPVFSLAAEDLQPIEPSDYLVQNAEEYLTVGNLSGLEATQYNYEITDEDVRETAIEELGLFFDETETDRPAEEGDIVYADIIYQTGSMDEEDSEYADFCIGDEDYGEEFDRKLLGASAGDVLEFEITYSEEDAEDLLINEEWAGETVSFEVEIDLVCEYSEPEYTDEFVAENTDYDSTADFEADVRAYLEEEYAELSYMDVLYELMDAAQAECTVNGYPEDLYESCYEETISDYAMYAGSDDVEEILDLFEITEDDLEEEVQNLVSSRLLISYLCEQNDVSVTEEEYLSYVELYAEYYEYDSAAEFEEDWGRSYLVWSMYESSAGEILYDMAEITVQDAALDEEYSLWD